MKHTFNSSCLVICEIAWKMFWNPTFTSLLPPLLGINYTPWQLQTSLYVNINIHIEQGTFTVLDLHPINYSLLDGL